MTPTPDPLREALAVIAARLNDRGWTTADGLCVIAPREAVLTLLAAIAQPAPAMTPTPDPLTDGRCAYRCPLSVEGHHNRHDCDHAYQVAATSPNAGSHGDGATDTHYDPGCGRCIEQRDQTRPDVPWDTIYAEVEP